MATWESSNALESYEAGHANHKDSTVAIHNGGVPHTEDSPNIDAHKYLRSNGAYHGSEKTLPGSDHLIGDDTNSASKVNGGSPESQHEKSDGGEQGKDYEDPPKPVGFFDKRLNHVRKFVLMKWGQTTLLLSVFILAVLSLYWAVFFHVDANQNSLIVFVVDFDGQAEPFTGGQPLLGPMVTQATEKMVKQNAPLHLGYVTVPPSAYDNDPMAVRQAVYDFEAWAAVIINPNATALLRAAVDQGNASYDPLGAASIVYVQARDQDTYDTYIMPTLSQLTTEITSMFGETWAKEVMSNTSISRTALANAPQALSPAIGFSQFNLRPFLPPQATPAVTIGLIYLIIIAFFSFTFFMPVHTRLITPQGHPPLHFYQLILWRWASTIVAYLIMSCAYSLISLAFQIPFANPSAPSTAVANSPSAYGHLTFFVYWMINFIGMTALGLSSENVTMVIGQPWTALWLIFWVITNVSTSFYPIELSPRFFYWGYAWPLHNIVEASRSTLFDLHSRIGLNFGVLFAWCAINTLLFPVCCYLMRWKSLKEEKEKRGD